MFPCTGAKVYTMNEIRFKRYYVRENIFFFKNKLSVQRTFWNFKFLNHLHQNVEKIWERGCFCNGSQTFFPTHLYETWKWFKTLNIHYKVSWNILKHKFIILKLKFELFWMVNKNFQRGCFSHAHPDNQKNVPPTTLPKISPS